ncbi:MAG TPA: DUF1028 domain-containing protein [Phycisphaerae bacterium]|jgi:uncharacterized Ntn-hydrolase superfamily protein
MSLFERAAIGGIVVMAYSISAAQVQSDSRTPVHTYSIVARDPQTGQLGVAVQSHYFSVGPIVPWAEAGVGAVATQSLAKVDYGPDGLALMRQGLTATQALAALLENDDHREVRQVAMIDAKGNVATHTGAKCIAAAGHLTGENFSVQANLMLNDSVWPAMKKAFESAPGDLADRLLAALEGAQAAGGDIRGQQSAAILVVSGEKQDRSCKGRIFDLRVEDHPRPVEELKRLVRLQRAYRLTDEGDDFVAAQKFDEALTAYAKAAELAPDVVELKFWQAVTLFKVGKEDESLRIFREVFAKEPLWAEVVPRVVPLDLLPNDPAAIKRITDLRPGKRD